MWRVCSGVGVAMLLACSGLGNQPSTDQVTSEPAPTPSDPPEPEPQEPADETPVCPEGVVTSKGWPGEYPEPIANVWRRVKVPARTHPCGVPDTACELEPGVYHPWSKSPEGVAYLHLNAERRFVANSDTSLGTLPVKKGTRFTVTRYAGEGICEGVIGTRLLDFQCPGVGDDDVTELPNTTFTALSLFKPACGAWVDANAIMGIVEVTAGEVLGYGEVGPADR